MILRWLPRAAVGIVHEVGRHLLRRPVVGVAAVARTRDDRYVLIRRGDTGTWCLPGGTLEWGETLRAGLARELEEEAGIVDHEVERVLGVWSDPRRDPRFHAVTVGVLCRVGAACKPPINPLEIREVRSFARAEIPSELAFGMIDIVRSVDGGQGILE